MKLPTSTKTASFGKKPHIKKGYYPGKLLKVEPFTDSDGNLREGKYGRQLLFHFAVYKADADTGTPIEPLTYSPKEEGDKEDVVIPKFVYHEYKNKKTGEFQTAITPNSAITKILKALGWEFAEDDVDTDVLIGKWVELNIDDYTQKGREGEEDYKASTIKDINPYEGPEPGDVREAVPKTPKKVEKQVKHKAVKKEESKKMPGDIKELESIADKKKELKKLRDEGVLRDTAYNDSIEQLQAREDKVNAK